MNTEKRIDMEQRKIVHEGKTRCRPPRFDSLAAALEAFAFAARLALSTAAPCEPWLRFLSSFPAGPRSQGSSR